MPILDFKMIDVVSRILYKTLNSSTFGAMWCSIVKTAGEMIELDCIIETIAICVQIDMMRKITDSAQFVCYLQLIHCYYCPKCSECIPNWRC